MIGVPGWERRFVAYFYFVGFDCISLGLHLCWSLPNIEVHVPFGFFRIGWVSVPEGYVRADHDDIAARTFGIQED